MPNPPSVRSSGNLHEHLEDPRERFLREAYAVVGDSDYNSRALSPRRDLDVAAGLCVLGGVGQQVAEDLREPQRIGVERQRLGRQVHVERVAARVDQRL